jgi:chloramphenicol-sensitive protein RarD
MDRRTQGAITALTACLLWGLFPIYWKALKHVPATQILAHRVIWSLLFLILLLSVQSRWGEVKALVSSWSRGRTFLVTSLLLGANWWAYVWAVNTDQIVESSLGYFILPLVNVMLGRVFLKERLNRAQTLAVGLAFIGVLLLTVQYGRVPWIAFTLAFSFGVYGLLRKTARAESMVGLSSEMGILLPISLIYLVVLGSQGSGAFDSVNLRTDILLAGAGVVTAIPLLLYAHAVRRIRYSTIGLLQYISPTGHLLLGVFLYREPFTHVHAISFACVWMAILIYSISSLAMVKRKKESW